LGDGQTRDRNVGSATLEGVARVAGVSRATVSRVVNGEPGVSPELGQRVRLAIERLDYRRNLDPFYDRVHGVAVADAGESADAVISNWDPHIPDPPTDWLTKASFELTLEESEYLYQRVATRAPNSLLAHLLLSRQAVADDEEFPWDVEYQMPLSRELVDQLAHARNLSEVMHGAALLYNLLLAEQKSGGAFVETYRERLQQWWDRLSARRTELLAWDRAAFWRLMRERGTRVRGVTRQFVDQWLNLTFAAPSLSAVSDAPIARRLVTDQERSVKPGRARIGNERATENWEGASGSAQLNYRWNRPVRAVVNDILGPLTARQERKAAGARA